MPKDYYKILGVGKDAGQDEIKKAYKKLAKQWHPDINKSPEAAERFKEINEAAAVLGDPKKREQFDRFGTAEFAPGFEGFDSSQFRGFGFDFDQIFEQFARGFGFDIFGGARERKASRGNDLLFELEIELEDVANGITKTISVERLARCESCNGIGGEGIKECETCRGSGMERQSRRTPFGFFVTQTTCSACHGSGETVQNTCKKCKAHGRIHDEAEIEVKIPAGIEDGMRLRLSGEGDAGERGSRSGDLYVQVRIRQHSIFRRQGQDLYVEAPLQFATACLGGSIEVPTLDGIAKLKIPEGTQSGTMFKLHGKGLPSLRSHGRGDQLVRVYVEVPKKLSKKQEQMIKEFEKLSGEKRKWWQV